MGSAARRLSPPGRRSRGVLGMVAGRIAHRQRPRPAIAPTSFPGIRYIDGRPYYSAEWLNRPEAAHRYRSD